MWLKREKASKKVSQELTFEVDQSDVSFRAQCSWNAEEMYITNNPAVQ